MGLLGRLFTTFLVLGLSAACARASGPGKLREPVALSTAGPKPDAASRPPDRAGTKAFIWKATRAGEQTKTVYLVGSVHVGRSDWYPLDPVFHRAYEESEALVVEVDLTQTDPAQMQAILAEYAVLEGGKTLRDVLSEPTWQRLTAYCREKRMNLEALELLEPWFLSMTIVLARYAEQGYTQPGIDAHFLSLGDKTVLALESLRYQLELFDNFEPEIQELLLLDAMEGHLQTGGDLGGLAQAWSEGDAGAIARMLEVEEEDPKLAPLREKLIDERNRNMGAGIEKILETRDTVLVVVGAGHVVGRGGLVDLLGRRGFEVVQLRRVGSR